MVWAGVSKNLTYPLEKLVLKEDIGLSSNFVLFLAKIQSSNQSRIHDFSHILDGALFNNNLRLPAVD